MFKFSIQTTSITTVISLIVSVINYLIDYAMGKASISDALSSNLYVKYWLYLTAFFFAITLLLVIANLLFKPKNKKLNSSNMGSEYSNAFAYPDAGGSSPVEEYVNVRMKKSELSKYQQMN
ncbi:hypothetical protein ACQKL5_12365 [Peribacillus sp. NPDC097675]|uniref:hypothetical protein n=1 Tax=Peribacillus sp. NPDC097675 TaxID=3390618 RepID=UPI003D0118E2